MKYLKQFESNTDKYVIVTNCSNELAVEINLKYKNMIYQIRSLKYSESDKFKIYTLIKAKEEIPKINKYYDYMYKFEIMPLEEFNIIKNSNKFNL